MVAYVVGASLVLGTARTVAEVLVLPPLFLTLLAGIAVVGLPVAVGAGAPPAAGRVAALCAGAARPPPAG